MLISTLTNSDLSFFFGNNFFFLYCKEGVILKNNAKNYQKEIDEKK